MTGLSLSPSAVVIPEFVGYVMVILLRPVPESIHITQIPNPKSISQAL